MSLAASGESTALRITKSLVSGDILFANTAASVPAYFQRDQNMVLSGSQYFGEINFRLNNPDRPSCADAKGKLLLETVASAIEPQGAACSNELGLQTLLEQHDITSPTYQSRVSSDSTRSRQGREFAESFTPSIDANIRRLDPMLKELYEKQAPNLWKATYNKFYKL